MKGIEFTILDIARIWSDKSWNVAMNTVATLSDPNPKHEFARAPCMSILIKHPDAGLFLFDTGFTATNVATRTPFQLEHFHLEPESIHFVDERLKELGYSVNDIDGIILSHLHWDHADGLELFQGTKAIKNVYVQKKELTEGLLYTHGAGPKDPGDPIYSKRILDMDEIEYHFVNKDTEIFPGMTLLTVTGHTQGGLVLVLELENDTFIFTGDAIVTAANFGPPARLPGIIADSLGFFESVEKVREWQIKKNATMVYSHDPQNFESLKKAPYFYK